MPDIVRRALKEPLRWIVINAGPVGDEVVAEVTRLPIGQGLTALTGQYGDMLDFGIIDPLKVTRTARPSAIS